ncbi:MAG: hypothetical protein E7241_10475 [Lachnospiraceae bacterium]|jgi:hypothetical protein|nr:hypothetical protein [Lachnospiraceae bacterium]
MKRVISVLVLVAVLMMWAGCGGKQVKVPFGSEERVSTSYEKAYGELTKAGFTNIKIEPVNTAHKGNVGNLESITINGKSFKKYESFSEDAEVVIRHYVDVEDNSKVQIKFWK